jgi:hypothetical protein
MSKKIKQRLREPSTWAGLSLLATIFGLNVPPGTNEALQGLLMIFGGGAAAGAVALPEKANNQEA